LRVVERNPLLFSLYVPTLILSFATGMLSPIMPLYARSFEISYALIGVVLAAQGVGNLIGDIPAGILLGRIGHRWLMVIGVGILGLAMLAVGLARSVPLLILFGLVAGMGNAMWNISRHAYMTSNITLKQRGRATATFGGLNRIGSFAGPAVGAALGAAYGLRAPFVVFAGVAGLALVLSAIFVNDPHELAPHRGGLRGHSLHLVQIVRAYVHILSTAGVGQLFAQMIRTGRNSLIPLYAADVVGLDLPAIGWIITLAAAIDMAMFYPAGLIMDRYGRKYATVPSFALQGIGMALVALASTFGGLLAATLVIGFGNGLGSGTMLTLGSDLAPKQSMGEFLGVWRLIGDAGGTGAPMVVGGVADLVGLSMATLVMAAVGLIAAGIFAFLVPETLHGQPVAVQAKATGD
jgi:MFS family permease